MYRYIYRTSPMDPMYGEAEFFWFRYFLDGSKSVDLFGLVYPRKLTNDNGTSPFLIADTLL